jgi:Skp family chaperone for outer membrane proteins
MKKLLFVAVLGLGFAACGGANSSATNDSTAANPDSVAQAVQTAPDTTKAATPDSPKVATPDTTKAATPAAKPATK